MSQDTAHQLAVDAAVYRRWCSLGTRQGFSTDSQIAAFLLHFYEENYEKNESKQRCIICQRTLPHVCNVCEPTQQEVDNNPEQQQHHVQQQQPQNSSREVTEQQKKGNESPDWACQQSNASTSPSHFHSPCGSVFRRAGRLVSARNLVHCPEDQQFFTNVYAVTEDDIRAGKFCLLQSTDRHKQTACTTDTQDVSTRQTDTDASHLPPGQIITQTPNLSGRKDRPDLASQTTSDHTQNSVTRIVRRGQPFPVRIFHTDNLDSVAVDAMFTNCARETRLVTEPATQEEGGVRESEQTQRTDQQEISELDDRCEDTGLEEDGGGAGGGSGEGELEAKNSADMKLQFPPDFHNRQAGYNTARKTWGRPPYLCQKCGASFNSTSSLTRHILKHTGERPFPCPECTAAFATRPELTVHFRKHTGEKPFLCPICGSAYDRSSNLHTHLRTHTGERPFKCDQCNGGFTTSSSLTRHKRIHTGEKPYVCNQCSAAFPQLGHLKEHLHRHTGVKPYQCQQCGAAFSTMSRLRRHHRKVQCAKH